MRNIKTRKRTPGEKVFYAFLATIYIFYTFRTQRTFFLSIHYLKLCGLGRYYYYVRRTLCIRINSTSTWTRFSTKKLRALIPVSDHDDDAAARMHPIAARVAPDHDPITRIPIASRHTFDSEITIKYDISLVRRKHEYNFIFFTSSHNLLIHKL